MLKGQVIFENGKVAEFYLDDMEVEALEERISNMKMLNIADEFIFSALWWMEQEGILTEEIEDVIQRRH